MGLQAIDGPPQTERRFSHFGHGGSGVGMEPKRSRTAPVGNERGIGVGRPSAKGLVALGAALALSLTACGSRLGQARLEATNNVFKQAVDTHGVAGGPAAAPADGTDTNGTAGD